MEIAPETDRLRLVEKRRIARILLLGDFRSGFNDQPDDFIALF